MNFERAHFQVQAAVYHSVVTTMLRNSKPIGRAGFRIRPNPDGPRIIIASVDALWPRVSR